MTAVSMPTCAYLIINSRYWLKTQGLSCSSRMSDFNEFISRTRVKCWLSTPLLCVGGAAGPILEATATLPTRTMLLLPLTSSIQVCKRVAIFWPTQLGLTAIKACQRSSFQATHPSTLRSTEVLSRLLDSSRARRSRSLTVHKRKFHRPSPATASPTCTM